MDLEDLVERLQSEATSNGRRTSDYFSDAGTPVRHLDNDGKNMDAERMVRKVEQEKAQLRLDMLEKVQEEREIRRTVEAQVKELEDLVSRVTWPRSVFVDVMLSSEKPGFCWFSSRSPRRSGANQGARNVTRRSQTQARRGTSDEGEL